MKVLKYTLLIFLLTCLGTAQAHIGSPGVSYQGKAGKYDVIVNVMPPDVIPAEAQVSIYIENYNGEKVYVQAEYYGTGPRSSPLPELATAVKGAKGWFEYSAMVMKEGSAGMKVRVVGSKGTGEVNIPVMAAITAQRVMTPGTGIVLSLLAVLLFVLMVTMVGACAADGVTPPGEKFNLIGKKRRAMAITAVIFAVILVLGFRWFKQEHADYQAYMYRPMTATSTVVSSDNKAVLHMQVNNLGPSHYRKYLSYVVPDHGKLMHLFLIKQGSLDVFAHLHPVRKDTLDFYNELPQLPAGRYLLYGDVVLHNAFSETIPDTVDIPERTQLKPGNLSGVKLTRSSDDAYLFTNAVVDNPNTNFGGKPVAICGNPGTKVQLEGGLTAILEHQPNAPFIKGKYSPLTFSVEDANGKPAKLEPYMGMAGHAVVLKHDGSVYVHLHPIGNYAMASQELLDKRMADNTASELALPDPKKFRDSVNTVIAKLDNMTDAERDVYLQAEMEKNMSMANGKHSEHGSTVIFPYSFPSVGKYRIWVQVKVGGKILSGAFDAEVK